MNKRERLRATIAGEAVDRPAVAIWRHWPGDDQRPEDLVAAHVHWQKTYDFDLVKLMPASTFAIEDWGIRSDWIAGDEGTRTRHNVVLREPEDWRKLAVLDPSKGALGQAVETARLAVQALGRDAPVIMTVFSPLSQAKSLAGDNLLPHLRQHPEAVLAGLEAITGATVRFAGALKSTGIDGIFYAAQLAEAQRLSRSEYQRFGRPFDLRILEAASGDCWFNMLHIHGLATYAELFADYPVQAVNWHDRDSGPSLAQGLNLFKGAVSGGLSQQTVLRGTPDDVRQQAVDAIAQTGGRRLILSTGCVAMITSPLSNLRAARESVGA